MVAGLVIAGILLIPVGYWIAIDPIWPTIGDWLRARLQRDGSDMEGIGQKVANWNSHSLSTAPPIVRAGKWVWQTRQAALDWAADVWDDVKTDLRHFTVGVTTEWAAANTFGGSDYLLKEKLHRVFPEDSGAYWWGRVTGGGLATLQGIAQMFTGAGLAAGGTALSVGGTAATAGIGGLVAIPAGAGATAAGAATAAHGAGVAGTALFRQRHNLQRAVGLPKEWRQSRPRSRALARNMEAAGRPRPLGYQAHHLVAGKARQAAEARQILARWQIDINDPRNGVWLPNAKTARRLGQKNHQNWHTKRYYNEVNARLGKATSREEALDILRKIADKVSSGQFPH